MLFELKNKMPRNSQFLRSEDVLTSTIFGNLRYFSNPNILINFLNKSLDINNNNLELENNQFFKICFWKKHFNDNERKYNETDLFLLNNNYEIIIECKYHSPLSEESEIIDDKEVYYSNQLIRYSKIIENSVKKKIVIFLTDDPIMPIEIIKKTLTVPHISNKIKIYWLSWSKLYLSLNEYKSDIISENEKILLNDLIEFLEKRKLISFIGFTKYDCPNISFYKRKYDFQKINILFAWKYKTSFHYNNEKVRFNWRYNQNE
jgi:hypothetical protein